MCVLPACVPRNWNYRVSTAGHLSSAPGLITVKTQRHLCSLKLLACLLNNLSVILLLKPTSLHLPLSMWLSLLYLPASLPFFLLSPVSVLLVSLPQLQPPALYSAEGHTLLLQFETISSRTTPSPFSELLFGTEGSATFLTAVCLSFFGQVRKRQTFTYPTSLCWPATNNWEHRDTRFHSQ